MVRLESTGDGILNVHDIVIQMTKYTGDTKHIWGVDDSLNSYSSYLNGLLDSTDWAANSSWRESVTVRGVKFPEHSAPDMLLEPFLGTSDGGSRLTAEMIRFVANDLQEFLAQFGLQESAGRIWDQHDLELMFTRPGMMLPGQWGEQSSYILGVNDAEDGRLEQELCGNSTTLLSWMRRFADEDRVTMPREIARSLLAKRAESD